MFMIWTIATLWLLLLFGQTFLEQPIAAHQTQSLLLFLPSTTLGWILVVSWLVPVVGIAFRVLYAKRLLPGMIGGSFPLFSLGTISNMKWFDGATIVGTVALAVIGWTNGSAALLLLCTIIAIGLSLNAFEQWYVG